MSTATIDKVRILRATMRWKGNLLDLPDFKKLGKHALGNGLILRVRANADGSLTRDWYHRYSRGGARPEDKIGSALMLTVEEAAAKVDEANAMLAHGNSPRGARISATSTATFKDCAEEFLEARFGHKTSAELPAGSLKQHLQFYRSLERYYPALGGLSINQIDVSDVANALKPNWHTIASTASVDRTRIALVFKRAHVQKKRAAAYNPADLGDIITLIGDNEEKKNLGHHASLGWQLVPAFIQRLRQREGLGPVALEFSIRTAKRTSEVILARWSEIDLEAGLWTIPAERMKVKKRKGEPPKPHEVPLSPAVVELLRPLHEMSRGEGYVFPGRKRGTALTNSVMLNTIANMGHGPAVERLGERPGVREGEVITKDGTIRLNFTTHGFRSSFGTWGDENEENEIHTEMALDHAVGNATRRAYKRSSLLDLRRQLMDRWNAFLDGQTAAPVEGDNVVPLRRAA